MRPFLFMCPSISKIDRADVNGLSAAVLGLFDWLFGFWSVHWLELAQLDFTVCWFFWSTLQHYKFVATVLDVGPLYTAKKGRRPRSYAIQLYVQHGWPYLYAYCMWYPIYSVSSDMCIPVKLNGANEFWRWCTIMQPLIWLEIWLLGSCWLGALQSQNVYGHIVNSELDDPSTVRSPSKNYIANAKMLMEN
jgi:hypothetical protein